MASPLQHTTDQLLPQSVDLTTPNTALAQSTVRERQRPLEEQQKEDARTTVQLDEDARTATQLDEDARTTVQLDEDARIAAQLDEDLKVIHERFEHLYASFDRALMEKLPSRDYIEEVFHSNLKGIDGTKKKLCLPLKFILDSRQT